MMAAMWAKFVDTSMIYSGVVKECRRFGYVGGCPVAESVADRLITLPNYAALTGAGHRQRRPSLSLPSLHGDPIREPVSANEAAGADYDSELLRR